MDTAITDAAAGAERLSGGSDGEGEGEGERKRRPSGEGADEAPAARLSRDTPSDVAATGGGDEEAGPLSKATYRQLMTSEALKQTGGRVEVGAQHASSQASLASRLSLASSLH